MNDFDKEVLKTYNILKFEKDLSPNNCTVNKALNHLVCEANECHKCCLGNYKFSEITNKILPEFRCICAKAESEMEKFWAHKFIADTYFNADSMKEFWYYKNYEYIAAKELVMINRYFSKDSKVKMLFAGSGSLPLSAIFMNRQDNIEVSLLDIDKEAVALSSSLINKLNLPIKVFEGDILKHPVSEYDIVFIASLIPEKIPIIERLRNEGVSHYMARGVDGVYKAFYEDLQPEIKMSAEHFYMPSDDLTLNSSYIFKAT
jgi:hypothetical protein